MWCRCMCGYAGRGGRGQLSINKYIIMFTKLGYESVVDVYLFFFCIIASRHGQCLKRQCI